MVIMPDEVNDNDNDFSDDFFLSDEALYVTGTHAYEHFGRKRSDASLLLMCVAPTLVSACVRLSRGASWMS